MNAHLAEDVDIILFNVYDEGGQFTATFREHEITVSVFVDLAFQDVNQVEKQWIPATYDSGKIDSADISEIISHIAFRCRTR